MVYIYYFFAGFRAFAAQAINLQLTHYLHYIAKMATDENWESLSIPLNKSNDYNTRKFTQEKAKRHFTDDP